ncbi:MAG: hypothetical protein PHI98_16600 [Eubacteriales bacterium]|nr:hypothetical protein [Eubacteriales bacterium]
MIWVVFKDKAGKELLSYTANGTFAGEADETKALLAYENELEPNEIMLEIQDR